MLYVVRLYFKGFVELMLGSCILIVVIFFIVYVVVLLFFFYLVVLLLSVKFDKMF